jgi:CPA2 family monovalent cation:H+ antiporter-2
MSHGSLLQELVIVYAAALALLVVAGRLHVPPIVALIVSGIITGPAGLRVVGTQADVEVLAEIGIALLLFTAGLDFSVTGLRRTWGRVVFGGAAQMLVTAAVVMAIAVALGESGFRRLVVLGVFVALSSTAIVIKELTRHNQAHSPHGQLVIGVLLLQDLAVIVLLVLTPVLFGKDAALHGGSVTGAIFRVTAVLAGVALVARMVLPAVVRLVSATGREAFSLAVLLASIGTAWLTSLAGLSMAVGAFLAGLVLAESEVSHQVHAEVRPLRDLLASLFFISVGMLVDPRALASQVPLLIGLAALILIVKGISAAGAFALTRTPLRVAAAAGVALAQVGEFSLLFGGTARTAGLISDRDWQPLLGAAILTMMAGPGLVVLAPAAGARVASWWRGTRQHEPDAGGHLRGHVVVLGYGAGGRVVARALRDIGVTFVALDLNGRTVQEAAATGEPLVYADVTAPEALEAAGVAHAAAVVAVLSDPDATERAVRSIRTVSATVPIVARTRYRLEAERLLRAGATIAVAEEIEASFEVVAQLLARLEIPGNIAEVLLGTYRQATYAEPARGARAAAVPFDALPLELTAAPVTLFRLPPGAWSVGRTLAAIDLRADTGATILAIRRHGRTMTSPAADVELAAEDDLYIMGDEVHVRVARARLEQGPFGAAPDRSDSGVRGSE